MKSAKPSVPAVARAGAFERAFLPAALEIIESPPSPTARLLGGTIIGLFCLTVAWASFGTIDIVAIAPGKIVPAGRTKTIQPVETGVVRAINVRDGQRVKAGDVLIELDPTMTAADVEHLKGDLLASRLDVARLRAASTGRDDFAPPEGASARQVEMQRGFLAAQWGELRSKIAETESQASQKRAEQQTIAAGIAKLEATIPVIKERVEVRKVLYDKELGSKITYLTELQDLVGQQQDLLIQKSKLKESDAAVAALEETKARLTAEFRHKAFDDLVEAEQKVGDLSQDVIKAQKRSEQQVLTASVDGVVQQLSVHTIGGVVTPAQTLAVVVPYDSQLEIEADIPNRDIGFVAENQEAQIKVDTFPFTRYGLLRGRVLSISGDAITRGKDNAANGAPGNNDAPTSEPRGQQFVYAARISLDRTQMQVDDRVVQLSPGMAVTAEIVTGHRRIIDYLLSPLVKYGHEVMRER